MKTSLLIAALAVVSMSGCGRTNATCVAASDCDPGQVCTANGCIDLPQGGGGAVSGGGGGVSSGGGSGFGGGGTRSGGGTGFGGGGGTPVGGGTGFGGGGGTPIGGGTGFGGGGGFPLGGGTGFGGGGTVPVGGGSGFGGGGGVPLGGGTGFGGGGGVPLGGGTGFGGGGGVPIGGGTGFGGGGGVPIGGGTGFGGGGGGVPLGGGTGFGGGGGIPLGGGTGFGGGGGVPIGGGTGFGGGGGIPLGGGTGFGGGGGIPLGGGTGFGGGIPLGGGTGFDGGVMCPVGFADCDGSPFNGCETNLNSVNNCGGCFNRCQFLPNSTPTCSMGVCGSTCRPNFADCDAIAGNGCESNLNAPTSCGSCSNACSMSDSCNNGMCVACPATKTLSLNTTAMGSLPIGAGVLAPPTCAPNSTRAEDVWTLDVPTPAFVTIETQNSSLDTVLFVRAACGSTSDLACDDDIPGGSRLSRVELTLQPGRYFVIVKEWGQTMGMQRQYSLSATAVTNTTCSAGTLLSPGVSVLGNSANGVTPSNACVASTGGELFYRFEVPANSRGEVRMTPAGTANLTTRLKTSCTANTCVSASQGVTQQVVTFDNPSGATQTMFVSVAAMSSTQHSAFTIVGTLTMLPPRPYLLNTIPASCDDLTMGQELLGPTTTPLLRDDEVTGLIPLPFPFTYWSTPVTQFSASSNGFIQLHASMPNPIVPAFQNLGMPTAAAPNGVVAAFWDDLGAAPSGSSAVRALSSGTMPNRVFTVQWGEMMFIGGNAVERLTFQAKLFETTNIIEVHYCSMQANGSTNPRVLGSGATVGVENLAGTDAVQHSFNQPIIVSGQGLRFTP